MANNQIGIPRGAEFAFGAAAATLTSQAALVDALDAKVGILLAAEGVLAGFIFGSSRDVSSVILILSLVSLLTSAAFAIASFWPRRFASVPDARTLGAIVAGNPGLSEPELKWMFIRNAVEGIEDNRFVLHGKLSG